MADTQNPVHTDNATVFGDGTVDHPLSGNVSPAQATNIPLKATVTLTAAQLLNLSAATVQILPPPTDPTKKILLLNVFAKYNAGSVGYGNVAGNLLFFILAAASGASPAVAAAIFATIDPSAAGNGFVNVDMTQVSGANSNDGASSMPYSTLGAILDSAWVGKGLFLAVNPLGDLTLGNGTLTITVWYYLI